WFSHYPLPITHYRAKRCIRAEGIRIVSSSGTGEANANGEDVRPIRGRKSKMRQSSVKLEAHTD
ncbi:hypothetical protein PJF56_15115, partial [Roseofilum sp. BLCC_M91]